MLLHLVALEAGVPLEPSAAGIVNEGLLPHVDLFGVALQMVLESGLHGAEIAREGGQFPVELVIGA